MRALGAILILLLPFSAAAFDLPLRANAEVGGSQVLLRDLVSGADAAQLSQTAGTLRLFRAPDPGMTRKVSRQTLARLIGRQVDTRQLRLTGAESVTISRKGIWIEPAEVEMVLGEYLARAAAGLPGVSLAFSQVDLPPRFLVAAGKIEHQVIPSSPEIIGSRRLNLVTRVDGEVVANQSLRVEISARAEVVVVTRELRRGDELNSADLGLQQRDITRLDEPFFRAEALLGKRLRQGVRLGEPLLRHQVEFPPLIRRGDRVTLQLSGRGLRLMADGEARQNGELGETIRVRNSSSQREIEARVVAAGLVQVEF